MQKHEKVTKQGFCKILRRKLRPRGSLIIQFQFLRVGWGGAYQLFLPLGWALIRGGRLFEVARLFSYGIFFSKNGIGGQKKSLD